MGSKHNWPRKLNSELRQQVLQSPKVLELATVRDQLSAQIEEEYGVITIAIGEPMHRDTRMWADCSTAPSELRNGQC